MLRSAFRVATGVPAAQGTIYRPEDDHLYRFRLIASVWVAVHSPFVGVVSRDVV
jgi:hypothetical protein